MEIDKVISMYFGRSGISKRISTAISGVISENVQGKDLLTKAQAPQLSKDDAAVIALPASNGRLTKNTVRHISSLQGSESPAVAVVICNDRGFGDSLFELSNLLRLRGFSVIAAAAFIESASGRPDDSDFSKLVEFATLCAHKLEKFCGSCENLCIPRNLPHSAPYFQLAYLTALFRKKQKRDSGPRREPQWYI